MPPTTLLLLKRVAALAPLCLLTACASLAPDDRVEARAPAQWVAPLPHQGSVDKLSGWWEAQRDPLLVELIRSAQEVSPTVSSALARVESQRAQQAAAQAKLLPSLSAQTGLRRGIALPGSALATRTDAGLQASWELDWLGANRQALRAAGGRVKGSAAQWHEARVSVAAEVAQLYYSLRSCRRQAELLREDAESRARTARLIELSARAGWSADAEAATAQASAAQSRSRLTQQLAQCDIDIKGLVALTGVEEAALRAKLPAEGSVEPATAPFAITSLPAQLVSQRPDVYAAEREVVWAAAQVGTAQAARLPRLSLDGSITAVRLANGGGSQDYTLWTLGPLALDLPIFDAGQRRAAVESARAGYRDAVIAYQGRVRQAVREVEEALVNLRAGDERLQDVQLAAQGYARALAATHARHAQGLASLLELEDARRSAVAARTEVEYLALSRRLHWISLYRAAGGGFSPDQPVAGLSQDAGSPR
ncbi:MAG: efflux transporter outer membrane subunit [Curvibacter sp.]|nr:efflux transporter outer membrane subunit [Curvibacter sp.]